MKELETIELLLDGQAHAAPRGTTLAALVAGLGHAPEKVTTAVNGLFVARSQRENHVLQPGDAVLLFRPIEGG